MRSAIYFIVLNVLILIKVTAFKFYDSISTANFTHIIFAHVTIRELPVVKCVSNAEGSRTDYKLRLNRDTVPWYHVTVKNRYLFTFTKNLSVALPRSSFFMIH